MKQAPAPLSDDPNEADALRDLFAEARANAPLSYDTGVGLSRHEGLIAGNTPPPGWASSAPVAASGTGLGKLLVAGLLATTVVAVAVVAWPDPAPSGRATPAIVVRAAEPAPETTAIEVPEEAAPEPSPARVEDKAVMPTHKSETERSPAERPPIGRTKRSAAELPPAAENGGADAVQREIIQTAKARSMLKTKPRQALAQLEATALEFPRGFLSEEREALSVLALHAMGREDATAARAKAFLEEYPGSSFAQRVRATVAEPAHE